MTVRSILDSKGHEVESIQPGATLSDAVKLLGEKKIGAVLVLNIGGRIEGILSDWSLPGAHTESAAYEVARTVCRRAERSAVRFIENGGVVQPEVIAYLNRLSDVIWLFGLLIGTRYFVGLVIPAIFIFMAIQLRPIDAQSLTRGDIQKITQVCRQVVGYPVSKAYDLWGQLRPFLRSRSELDHLIVDCSSQHCSGFIRLRDDAEHLPGIEFVFGKGKTVYADRPDLGGDFLESCTAEHGEVADAQGGDFDPFPTAADLLRVVA